MRIAEFFSRSDLDAIQAAVREAEARSAGEIVPYAVERSDHYAGALWMAATLGALLGALASALTHQVVVAWGEDSTLGPALWIALPSLAGAALGYLGAVAVPALRRALVPAGMLEHRVHQRAVAAFVEQEVFRARHRTGILVFLSLFERRVVILADSGIAARVGQHDWDDIVAGIVTGIRRGEPGRALAEGIRRCAGLLAAHGLAARPGERGDLSDGLRLEQE